MKNIIYTPSKANKHLAETWNDKVKKGKEKKKKQSWGEEYSARSVPFNRAVKCNTYCMHANVVIRLFSCIFLLNKYMNTNVRLYFMVFILNRVAALPRPQKK